MSPVSCQISRCRCCCCDQQTGKQNSSCPHPSDVVGVWGRCLHILSCIHIYLLVIFQRIYRAVTHRVRWRPPTRYTITVLNCSLLNFAHVGLWDEIHVHLCLRQCGTTSPITSRYPTLRMLCPTSFNRVSVSFRDSSLFPKRARQTGISPSN